MSDTARALPESVSALPVGTRLADFEIRRLLGVGGFGIVYLAIDHALEREVAIKEYMPASMAGRTATLHVSLRSRNDAEVFAMGLRSFVNEAKLLARFDHPSLIKVHRFWEAHGTAYMAMPLLRGRTLKDVRRITASAPDEAWIRSTITPLLGALELLHQEGVYHRDIAPDNIHLEAEGRPVLLDFGAARRVVSGQTQTLTAILKPAYAPIEQYAETGAVKQGPWTDLYALGATLHFMLLGYPPAPATARTVADEASELLTANVPGVGPQMMATIDWMLAPKPADRPQSVAALRAVLEGREPVPQRAGAAAPSTAWNKPLAIEPVTVPLGEERRPEEQQSHPAAAAAPIANGIGPPAPSNSAPPLARTVRSDGHAPPAVAPPAVAPPAAGPRATAAAQVLPMAADDVHRLPPPPARSRAVPLALALVVLVGVAGYALWSRQGGSGGAPAVSAAASSSAGAPVQAPPASAAASVPAPPAAAAVPAPPVAAAVPAPPVAAEAPMPPAAAAAPEALHAASQAAPAAAGRAAELGPGATPDARCAGRNPLSQFVCMERECMRPRFKNHPECQAWRQQARPRDAGGR
jgi:serine/threonine protein kinase